MDIALSYQEKGSGEPLILLHGNGEDSSYFRHQIAHFQDRYRVIALDTRGHGKSPRGSAPFTIRQFARDLLDFLEIHGIADAVLLGFSDGANIAMRFAMEHPERVKALILLGTPCTNRFNAFERICVPINRACMGWMPMKWSAWCIAAALGGSSPAARAYIRQVVSAMDHDVFNRVWKAATTMESRPGLCQITCPTLLLIGDRDKMTGRQQAFLHQSIAGSTLVTIRHANHGTNLDNPDQVEAEMEAFLAEHRL